MIFIKKKNFFKKKIDVDKIFSEWYYNDVVKMKGTLLSTGEGSMSDSS